MGAVAAGIAAAGSLLGGIAGGKGAKKAAKIQRAAVQDQIAATERNRDYQYSLNAPTINQGQTASDLFAGFIGAGSDPAASQTALDTFRSSSGYQDLVDEGLKAVNANAYAKGMGRSGATLKALQERGTTLANQSSSGWLNNLNTLMNYGAQARGLVAGVGTNSVNAINGATQTGADASSNASLVAGQNWAQALQGIGQAAASAYGSSYGSGSGGGYTPAPTFGSGPNPGAPYVLSYGLNRNFA